MKTNNNKIKYVVFTNHCEKIVEETSDVTYNMNDEVML